MHRSELRGQMASACRRLLSELDRDRYSATFGCFDRRYWAWKLSDTPELTYQRNVLALVWLLTNREAIQLSDDLLDDAIAAAFRYSARRQNRDGSFDQAFPGEHSYGATAFLLHDLVLATEMLRAGGRHEPPESEALMRRAADFLCASREQHGFIANHLAGAAAGLAACADLLHESRYVRQAADLVDTLLAAQAAEGWFPEYGGADPGYQSLCVYYLASLSRRHPSEPLHGALTRAIDFLTWFAHPDGTFGGEYGARRTALLYPGGLALLSGANPAAAALARFALASLSSGRLTRLTDLDVGNVAPMFANYMASGIVGLDDRRAGDVSRLPHERLNASADFPQAGLFVRGTERYYAVLGASNGGVLKVFNRQEARLEFDDSGYVGALQDGTSVTTQARTGTRWQVSGSDVTVQGAFANLSRDLPTPFRFIVLRLAGFTLLRFRRIREAIKRGLVRRLITPGARGRLMFTREVRFGPSAIDVEDSIRGISAFRWIESGGAFVSIHMASARYFPGFAAAGARPTQHDLVSSHSDHGEWRRTFRIE